jgi:hypothetical protein
VVRSWIRQALRASGVAILVPAAVAAAIALSVLGGGHNVGSLGEVLRGPAVPPAEAAPVRLRGQSPLSHVRLRRRASRSHERGQTPQVRRQAARTPATLPFRPAPRRPTPRPPASQHPAPAQAPPGSPAPPPPPQPHPIHDTGTQVGETVRPLPFAGAAAADAVEAVVNLVDPA